MRKKNTNYQELASKALNLLSEVKSKLTKLHMDIRVWSKKITADDIQGILDMINTMYEEINEEESSNCEDCNFMRNYFKDDSAKCFKHRLDN